SIEIPAGELEGPGGTLHVCAFRLLDHLVTAGELSRLATDGGGAGSTQGSDEPAGIEYTAALCFAHRAGGRLPSATELAFADRVHGVLQHGTRTCLGEFVADPQPGLRQGRMWLEYVAAEASLRSTMRLVADPDTIASGPDKQTGRILSVGFRVLFPC